ncbi:sugar lactone lactonase YvrE [Chryseobacterium bernardetii]|uniref:Sugar lactone lactonase YvrE n=1 Tax=Chryseobacterium bernardetii TaxID=1241978 RepID=A0ACC6IV90_9FLAO|nr:MULTISPECIES: T9SS type A sorting domain-containing protein [Chryseobacterium]MDR6370653.1 sugar lactone lactonase YvrE [Chryseobacterium vietnamense]MDR6441659.1 sugar lactone lactonase YvrE [Chryseobacterium bernardetii]
MKKIYAVIVSVILHSQIFSQVITVSTLAGNGTEGYADGNVNSAMFNRPAGVAVDDVGNVYVADTGNYRLRKITPSGNVSTLAGDGTQGFADGSPNIVKFNGINDLIVDAFGNIYVSDFYNNRIRKVSPSGDVSTFAGNGTAGFADGDNATAQFKNPAGIAIDKEGIIYVADQNNNRIRRITGGQVTTIAGDGVAGYIDGNALSSRFDYPTDIEVVGQDLYVVDNWNNKIRKISSGQVSTISGSNYGFADGTLANAKFYNPLKLVSNKSADLFITDTMNNRIRKISGNQVSTLSGSILGFEDGIAGNAKFYNPNGITIDNQGNLYIADVGNHRIRKIMMNNVLSTKELMKNREMLIYPNPAKNEFSLQSLTNEWLLLMDISGKKIKNINLKSGKTQNVDISSLPKGVYILTDGKAKSAKIIKE